MNLSTQKEKIEAALTILGEEATTVEKAQSLFTLLRGFDPKIDRILVGLDKSLSTLKNVQEGDFLELSAENLPEDSEAEKKRKKALLLFIKNWKELEGEVLRVKAQLESADSGKQTSSENVTGFAKILAFAKGPFGVLTIVAIVVVGAFTLVKGSTRQNQPLQSQQGVALTSTPTPIISPPPTSIQAPTQKSKVKVIIYEGEQIPLDQLRVATGPECTDSPKEAAHYHAAVGNTVRAIDGSTVPDPGGCGFGKVDELSVEEVEV